MEEGENKDDGRSFGRVTAIETGRRARRSRRENGPRRGIRRKTAVREKEQIKMVCLEFRDLLLAIVQKERVLGIQSMYIYEEEVLRF